MTTRMYAPPLGMLTTCISWQGWLNPYDYMQDDANTLDECRGMVEWYEVGTLSSRGGVLLRLRTRLLRLRARMALGMQLVGWWPDGHRICLFMPHILYLVAKLFEAYACYLLMLSIPHAVILHAIGPDMVISVIYPSHDIYSH